MKLGLLLICKNESAVIERCLKSVLPFIDTYLICDTGSTDDTVAIIKKTLKGVDGEIHHTVWKDFGSNRTESYQLAKGKADYWLFMDADQYIEDDFDKMLLTKDFYETNQVYGNMVYNNVRIIKDGLDWKSIGVIHEYWHADDAKESAKLDFTVIEPYVKEYRDGKKKNFIQILLKGIEDEPDNSRYLYYLANSYKDEGQHDKAIEWYNKRIEKGGWDEEVWHAMYQKGVCRIQQGATLDLIINDLMKAYNNRMWRVEPLYNLIFHLRQLEMYETAYWFGKHLGMLIDFPVYDKLFIEEDVYRWRFYDEMGVNAWFSGRMTEAKNYCGKCLEFKDMIPDKDLSRIENNLASCKV